MTLSSIEATGHTGLGSAGKGPLQSETCWMGRWVSVSPPADWAVAWQGNGAQQQLRCWKAMLGRPGGCVAGWQRGCGTGSAFALSLEGERCFMAASLPRCRSSGAVGVLHAAVVVRWVRSAKCTWCHYWQGRIFKVFHILAAQTVQENAI